MHEWTLAEATVESALRVARERGIVRVTSVSIALGDLQHIHPATFEEILGHIAASRGPVMADTRFDVASEPVLLRCRSCDHRWDGPRMNDLSPDDHELIHHMPEALLVRLHCPACSSDEFDVEKGRDVTLVSVTGETGE